MIPASTTNSLFFPVEAIENSSSSSNLMLKDVPRTRTVKSSSLKSEEIEQSNTRLSNHTLKEALTMSTSQVLEKVRKAAIEKTSTGKKIPEVNGYSYVIPPTKEAESNPFVIKPQSGREILALALHDQKSSSRKRERDNLTHVDGTVGGNASILDTSGVVPGYAATASIFSTSQVGPRKTKSSNASVTSRASTVNSMQSKSSSLANLPPAAAALARMIAKDLNRTKPKTL